MFRRYSARSGIMATVGAVLTALSFLVPRAALAADAVRVLGPGTANDRPELKVVSKSADGMRVEFYLPALAVEDIQVNGETYQSVAIPGGGDAGAVGAPTLPTFGRFVMVPDRAGVTVTATVEEEEEVSGYRLVPMQDEESTSFAYDPAAYSHVGYGDGPLARVGEPALIRGLRVVPVSFAPVRYDPSRGTLKIARRMTLQVSFAGEDLRNVPAGPEPIVPPSFDRLYRELVIGYEGPARGQTVQLGTYLVICPNDQGVIDRLQPLLDWRRREGYPVVLATTAVTGTTKEAIKSWVRNSSSTLPAPLEYLVLVGDAAGTYVIPTWNENLSGYSGEGDHPYTQLSGTDPLSDVFLGRLSIDSLTDLETIVAKTVGYESTPVLDDPGWFTRSCLVGDPTHSGYSCVQVMQWIKTRLRQVGYTQIDTVFSGSWVSLMANALNQGDTFFGYRGYWGFSGWSNSNTSALTNIGKLSYAVISTCGTGMFQGGTSNSEAFLRAGSATQQRGAIGSIGTATLGTHTRFNNCFTFGVAHGLFYDDLWEMGASYTRGKYELYLNYIIGDPDYVTIFSYWNNLMGDPACPIWTAYPQALASDCPATLPVGAKTVTVHVTEGGLPSEGALVCLYRPAGTAPELRVCSATDAGGNAVLSIPEAEAGVIKFTATKHNCRPVLSDITVSQAPVFVDYLTSTTNDDNVGASQGNGDGIVNPGETIELGVALQNYGSQPAVDVTATLSGNDPYVTLSPASRSFGTIAPGSSAWEDAPYVFSVSSAAPHGHVIQLGLDVVSGTDQWHTVVNVTVVSAHLTARVITLYNSGNGFLDPGETLWASIRLRNEGGAAASGVQATLTSLGPWAVVNDGEGTYPDIGINGTVENTTDRFLISALPSAYRGTIANFRLVTTFNSGSTDTTYVLLNIGMRTSTDPIGPDARGYFAFDDTDVGYPEAPVYSWVEINPTMGGPGTQVTLGDYGDYQDKSTAMNLPFPFQFYGQTFSRATICSNGWIAMGDTYLTDYRNWNIPGAGTPQNLIAVFWDDLIEVNSPAGHVYTWYDEANHRWIVEWSRMKNIYNSAGETFEAFLYDPAYNPTTNGDGIIVFQYNTVANVDNVDGYATVGIQNGTQTDGLLYTYFAAYPVGTAPLAANRAIVFRPYEVNTTATPAVTAAPAVLGLRQGRPNPFAGGATISFSLPKEENARLSIYDVQGRTLRTLVNGTLPAGEHTVSWDGRDQGGRALPAGAYFYRLEADGTTLVRKLVRVE